MALPLMQVARDEMGLAVVLSAPTPHAAFVLATCASNQQIEIGVKPGSQLSLHASAQGKVFLAFGTAEMRQRLSAGQLEAITPRTITDPAIILAQLDQIRKDGFASAPEEALLGVNAIAAPVYAHDGTLVGSVAFIGSVQHITAPPQKGLAERLIKLTADISTDLGYSRGR